MRAFIERIVQGATPSIDECVEALGPHLPLLQQFRETPQDPGWHAEGDVHIHTGMVLDEAYALLDGPAAHLDAHGRALVVLGALLHDIAKPVCTREQELRGVMRVVAKGHEEKGRSYLAPRLMGAGLPYPVVEALLGVVGHHHQPKLLVVKNREPGDYLRVSRLADPELLYWVELADMRGRTCADRADVIQHIELYRMFAEEYGAFARGVEATPDWTERIVESLNGESEAVTDRVLATARMRFERGEIRSVEEAIAKSYQERHEGSDLVITVGPSGSGKSTFVAKHLAGYDVVSLDDIREERSARDDQGGNDRVVAEARERLKASLRKKRPVVWDATSLRKDFRQRVAGLGFDYGALVTLVVFHQSTESYARRNAARDHAVEPSVLASQLDRMEWPDLDEAHRVVFVGSDQRVLADFGFSGARPFGLSKVPRDEPV